MVVRLAAVAAHLLLAVVYLGVILNGAVGPITAWILAIGWVVLAAWLLGAWWFDRRRIVLPPLVAGALPRPQPGDLDAVRAPDLMTQVGPGGRGRLGA